MTQTTSKHILKYTLLVFLISVPFLPWLILEIYRPPLRQFSIDVRVKAALQQTHKAFLKYFDENGKYPSAEIWQDLLLPYLHNEKDSFQLPSKNNPKNTIAINPNVKPDSPKDVVLLFESIGGWNAQGQEALLAPTSNGKPGCNIVFNDGYIKFVTPVQIKDLNWGNKP
jgi:hypothetical protein